MVPHEIEAEAVNVADGREVHSAACEEDVVVVTEEAELGMMRAFLNSVEGPYDQDNLQHEVVTKTLPSLSAIKQKE